MTGTEFLRMHGVPVREGYGSPDAEITGARREAVWRAVPKRRRKVGIRVGLPVGPVDPRALATRHVGPAELAEAFGIGTEAEEDQDPATGSVAPDPDGAP